MKYLLLLAVFIASSSCQKKVSTESLPAPAPNQQQGDPAPPPLPLPPAPAPTSQFPKAEIEYLQYIWTNQAEEIHIHVILNQASSDAITMEMSLVNSTAIYPRDYLGFAAGGPVTQTLVFPPGERIVHMPSVLIPDGRLCGTKFLIKLSANANEKVKLGSQAEVLLNCL